MTAMEKLRAKLYFLTGLRCFTSALTGQRVAHLCVGSPGRSIVGVLHTVVNEVLKEVE